MLRPFSTVSGTKKSNMNSSLLFLKLAPTTVAFKKGKKTTVKVTIGRAGVVVQIMSVVGFKRMSMGRLRFIFSRHDSSNIKLTRLVTFGRM